MDEQRKTYSLDFDEQGAAKLQALAEAKQLSIPQVIEEALQLYGNAGISVYFGEDGSRALVALAQRLECEPVEVINHALSLFQKAVQELHGPEQQQKRFAVVNTTLMQIQSLLTVAGINKPAVGLFRPNGELL